MILLDLFTIPRRQQDHVVPASFVSKLVAIHDEAQPIYDQSVRKFFGLGVPAVGSAEFRIAGFVRNLQQIRMSYEGWSRARSTCRIIDHVRTVHSELSFTSIRIAFVISLSGRLAKSVARRRRWAANDHRFDALRPDRMSPQGQHGSVRQSCGQG